MTMIIQVIDLHDIAIQYKRAVYVALRKVIMEQLNTSCEAANGDMSVTIEPLKPKEKRILIDKSVGDIHEHLIESQTYFRGFIATGTWMPINHMTTRPFPCDTQNALADMTVSLQHCKEYFNAERCSRDKVFAAVEIIRDEEARLCAEKERVALMEQAVLKDPTQPFAEKAASHLMELKASLWRMVMQDLHCIHATTGFETLIIGGSWVWMVVQKAIDLIFEDGTT